MSRQHGKKSSNSITFKLTPRSLFCIKNVQTYKNYNLELFIVLNKLQVNTVFQLGNN